MIKQASVQQHIFALDAMDKALFKLSRIITITQHEQRWEEYPELEQRNDKAWDIYTRISCQRKAILKQIHIQPDSF